MATGTYYDASVHPRQAEMLCLRGATDREIAEFFEIPVGTFYRWKNEHQEFANAIMDGKSFADDRVERALYSRAVGYSYDAVKHMSRSLGDGAGSVIETIEYVEHVPPDVKAAIRWLEARKPDTWRRALAVTGPGGGAIKVEDDTDFSGLSEDERTNLRELLAKAASTPEPGAS